VRATRALSPASVGAMENARRIPAPGGRQSNTEILDRRLAGLAGRQHGIVARPQLEALGFGEKMIRTRISHGALHPLHRGVYAVGHLATTAESRWMAAALALGPRAALSHRSAAQLWGLLPRGRIAPEVTAPGAKRIRKGIVSHRGSLPPDEITAVLGIPVTTAPRTILDLAATRPEREVERAWNEMEARRLTDPLSVPDLLARHPGRPGAAVLARLSGGAALLGRTRGELEERFLALLDARHVPRPRLNADLFLRDRFIEIDCLWERERVAVELDGAAVHGTDRAFHRDRERDRILVAEGYQTLRVTWRHLEEAPAELASDLRRILVSGPGPRGSD
jgi:very-short-patch-repair endonuclease